MSYVVVLPNQLQFFTNAWADPIQLMNLCSASLSQIFQTQAARDAVREQFGNTLRSVVTQTTRFPEAGFQVYINDAALKPLWENLLKSFDTKNRILETEEETRPSTAEVLNATQRVDDSTTAIRGALQRLSDELNRGSGYMNRTSFETILPWSAATAK
nr:coat protein [Streptocarpus flower break virus]